MKKEYGKKAAILGIALSISLVTACGRGETGTTGEKMTESPGAPTSEAVTEGGSTEEISTEETGSEETGSEETGSEKTSSEEISSEEISSEAATEGETTVRPKEPLLNLSGDPEDVTEVQEISYYEGDRFILYFQKGTKVRGNMAEHIRQIMKDEEELLGLSYEKTEYLARTPEYLWVLEEFGSDFNGLNSDSDKVNIMIEPYAEDGAVEWSDLNTILLFDEDFESEKNGMKTVYHEMCHVLRLRQSQYLGNILEEGIALYAEEQLCRKNQLPDWSLVQFFDIDGSEPNYDASGIQQEPEKMFREISAMDRSSDQPEYAYGIRLMRFLTETYGEDVVKRLSETAGKYSYGYDDTEMIIKVLKETTSEDVFEQFGRWLPEGWKKWCEEYREYMEPFGF